MNTNFIVVKLRVTVLKCVKLAPACKERRSVNLRLETISCEKYDHLSGNSMHIQHQSFAGMPDVSSTKCVFISTHQQLIHHIKLLLQVLYFPWFVLLLSIWHSNRCTSFLL
jgi:hypothetical protein